MEEKWEAFKDWVSKHADLLRDISDVLQSDWWVASINADSEWIGAVVKNSRVGIKGVIVFDGELFVARVCFGYGYFPA